MIETIYVLFWIDVSLIGIVAVLFHREIGEIVRLMASNHRDTPMIRNLRLHLKRTTKEQFQKDWNAIKSPPNPDAPTAKELIESFKNTPAQQKTNK